MSLFFHGRLDARAIRLHGIFATVIAIGVIGVVAGAIAAFTQPIYAVIAVVAVAAGTYVATNRQLTLMAFIGVATLLPYGVIPASIGGVRLTFIDLLLTLLLVSCLARIFAQSGFAFKTTPVDGILLLFIGLMIMSFIIGTAYSAPPEKTRQFFKLINSILFFFTTSQLVRTRRDLQVLTRALIVAGALTALVGIVLYQLPVTTSAQFLRSLRPLGYPTGEVLRYVEDHGVRTTTLRAIGTSVDPNVFGALLLMTGALTIGNVLASSGRRRYLLLAATGVIGYALLLSLSRGSWIGLAVAVGVLAIGRYRFLFWTVPLAALPLAVVFYRSISRYVEHFLKAIYAQDQATGMRLGEYKDALTLIQQNPWFGVGFGSAPSGDLYLGVSSTYLLIAEEMGVIGIAVYLIFVGSVMWIGIMGYRSASEQTQRASLPILAGFVGMVVSATFDQHYFNLRYQHIAALFFMMAALVILSSRIDSADNQIDFNRDHSAHIPAPVG